MKKQRKNAKARNIVKSATTSTLEVNEVNASNLPSTVEEEVVEVAEVVEEVVEEAKKPPKVSAKMRALMQVEAEAIEDETERKSALSFLKRLEEKELVSDGTTRASQSADTDKMKKFRIDFVELCESSCDGFEVTKRGGKKFFFTDSNGNKRVIRIYMKTEKEVEAEVEEAVKLIHDEAIEVES